MPETHNPNDPQAQLSPLKRALLALQDLRGRLETVEGAKREPIAIVGMGCRFPGGAGSPAAFWQLLCEGRDAIVEVPAERWDLNAFYDPDPQAPGRMYSRYGGFVDGIDQFDPAFFGISPREAVNMDPQQRLLLEVSWEALEHGGQAPQKLFRSRTGVFVGIANCDYLRFHLTDIAQVDTYSSTGNALSIAAGRLSYTLGLQGPAMVVDTACSSSLVTVHLACQSLRSGECDLALAGGVNLILSPDASVALSKGQMLARDGRCKTFDASADGYVRSEGCGMIVLKRLSDALRDGDSVLAVIRGSAINQDGRSNGLTAPNGLAQQDVIRTALERAAVEPSQVTYVEAHGTGTSLGDPMEVQALDAVLSKDRPPDQPLKIGSVKTNLGHLETAAGIAGLIKVVLALQHGEIPPHLHLRNPSPFIAWENLPIVVPTTRTAWPSTSAGRIAGISSFGYSGTNAHVVLQEAPAREAVCATAGVDRPMHVLTLSAKTAEALSEMKERMAQLLATPGAPALADVCYSAATGRSHFRHRVAVVGSTCGEVAAKLRSGSAVFAGERIDNAPEVAFHFSGDAIAAAEAAGHPIYETQPVFRDAFDRCGELTAPLRVFAYEYALAQLWRSWGIEPATITGEGIGEYVAACIDGELELENALRSVAANQPLVRAKDHAGGLSIEIGPAASENEYSLLLNAVANLYVNGVDIDWVAFDRNYPRRRVALPTYPFQRRRYWTTHTKHTAPSLPAERFHPLIERRLSLPLQDLVFETRLSVGSPAFLTDHRIRKTAIVPGALYLELALAAAAEARGSEYRVLKDVAFKEPMILLDGGEQQVDLVLTPIQDGEFQFQAFRRADGGWRLHASGTIAKASDASAPAPASLSALRARCSEKLDAGGYYKTLEARGLQYGPAFQGITSIARRAGEAFGEIQLPQSLMTDSAAYRFHPVLLDACLQVLGAAMPEAEASSARGSYMLAGMDRFVVHGVPGHRLFSHATAQAQNGGQSLRWDVTLFDADGHVVAEVLGLREQRVATVALRPDTPAADPRLYQVEWKPRPSAPPPPPIMSLIENDLPRIRIQADLDRYESLRPEFDALCSAWVIRAFETLGWKPQPDETPSADALMQQLGIATHHRRLLSRMLEILRRPAGELEPKKAGASLAAKFPASSAELMLLERCGQSLPEVLKGLLDPLQVLFPDGSLTPLERAYAEEPYARAGNSVIRQTILAALSDAPANRPLRIVEIGAGTGGTTAAVLPDLPPDRVEYVFTDVSQLFLRQARQKFRKHAFVKYQLLDIERDPESQGLPARHFDIVVAANVLHATSDLRITLARVQKLLRPGGLLILLEGTVPQAKNDLVFGLTGGWWRFTDTDLRPSHPLIPARSWLRLLAEAGFAEAGSIPRPDSPWAVIVGRQAAEPENLQEPWLILPDQHGVGARLSALFEARGERCVMDDSEHCRGIIDLRPLDSPSPRELCSGVLELVQKATAPIWFITAGVIWKETAVAIPSLAKEGWPRHQVDVPIPLKGADGVVGSTERTTPSAPAAEASQHFVDGAAIPPLPRRGLPLPLAPTQALVWGIGRVLANEQPELFGGLLDLDPVDSVPAQAAAIFETINRRGGEDRQVAWRGHERHVPRLTALPEAPATSALQLNQDASYLITGGWGGLGLQIAQWLAARGARNLVLSGRSGPSARAAQTIRELEQGGVTVMLAPMDVSNSEAVAAVLTRINREMPPLRGIIHAAGVLADGVLRQQDWTRFASVLAPKVDGARNLHEQTQSLPLDFFVLFSSAAAVLGAPGQSNYAAANSFLDALAHLRRAQGLPAVSINWGPWDGAGMAANLSAAAQLRYAQQGIAMVAPEDGLRLLERIIQSDHTQVSVLPVRWATYLRQFANTGVPALLSEIPSETRLSSAPKLWPARIAAAKPEERRQLLMMLVQEQAARVLRLDQSIQARPLSPREPLQDAGLDSLMAVELRNALGEALGLVLPATLLFDYPSVDALSGYLATVAAVDDRRPSPTTEKPAVADLRYSKPAGGTAEPIAIIGMGCRIPGGANDPAAFWNLLRNGVDAISEVPAERWDVDAYYDPDPDAPGKMSTRWGGFLGDVDLFDAPFFGITPREAVSMDPQQRLLLEVSWEALERAGQPPDRLQGSQTGVFIGISCYDYYHLARRLGDTGIDAYSSTGMTFSVAAGRLAYVLGLQGPTMAIDTACSSSLVTIHLACQSLRDGESDLALAGGVNLILSPENHISSSRLHAMAADGRCKTFDARADGYVRGEGCGIVVLKRLSDAERDRDPIVAVIRGSAVNQDGRSQGLTAPNAPAQEALIRRALATAGVRGDEIGYVEAHGTGTPLGDPIEVNALGAVLGSDRASDRPLVVGSVKTNIGHLESAAGIAAVIKVALVLEHGEIPRHLHLQQLNPYVEWDKLPLAIPTANMAWPDTARSLAGVSAFGYSGTNAHLILEKSERRASRSGDPARAQLLPISARSAGALEDLARAYRDMLTSGSAADLRDICYTASLRRSHHEHRLAVIGRTPAEMAEQLTGLTMRRGVCIPGQRRKLVFVFPGQGSQWLGMGRELLREEPAFRAAMARCDAAVQAETGWSVLQELNAPEGESRLSRIDVVQPVLFSMQVSLAELWRAWGIRPDAVAGHSMGEVAAAHVAGILILEEAAQIICRRSRLLTRVAGRGAMAMVELSTAEAQQTIAKFDGRLTVAVSNSARSTVLAGDPAALQQVLDTLEGRGIFGRLVKVDVASHSPYVDELRADLLRALDGLAPKQASIPMYSTVTGELVDGEALDPGYWARNLREPVLFASAIERTLAEGHELFIEISPHPVLLPALDDNLRAHEPGCAALPCLRRDEPERAALLGTLAALFTSGHAIDWQLLYPEGGDAVQLPTYAWQRQRYWITDQLANNPQQPAFAARPVSLLGTHVESSLQPGTHLWEQNLSVAAFPWLEDHRVQGLVVVPGAAYIELALAGAETLYGTRACTLEHIAFNQMLVLHEGSSTPLQLTISTGAFQIMSREPGEETWTLHARGSSSSSKGSSSEGSSSVPLSEGDSASHGVAASAGGRLNTSSIQARCREVRSGAELYLALERRGLQYGPRFQGVEQVWRGDGEALGLIHLPQTPLTALLDACLHVVAFAVPDADEIYVPAGVRSLRVSGQFKTVRWSYARLSVAAVYDRRLYSAMEPAVTDRRYRSQDPRTLTAELYLLDENGDIVLHAEGFEFRQLDSKERQARETLTDDWFYELQWQARPFPEAGPTRDGRWLIFADTSGIGASLAPFLDCDLVYPGAAYGRNDRSFTVNPQRPEDFIALLRDACSDTIPRGIVHLWSVDAATTAELTPGTLQDSENLVALSTLHLVQALAKTGWRDVPRLWLVTRGAQAVTPQDVAVAVAQVPLWGLARTIAYEHPELACTRIDLQNQASDAADLLRELGATGREDQVAVRGDQRFVARLARAQRTEAEVTHKKEPAGNQHFRLEALHRGMLDALELRAVERAEPGPGEVEIEVVAAGLNFLDVLTALDAIPVDPPSLGGECSGRIVRVGEGVDDFAGGHRPPLQIGQEVLGLAPWSFGRFAVAPRALVAAKPPQLSFEEAATVPVAFLTAYYSLCHVARLTTGERILIHAASGGVGVAAIQIAQDIGAEIYATAGSAEKRAWLGAMGVQHVMDSRSLAFADEIRASTGGEGVDVVLNSLSGEFIAASLDLLRDYGRFVEIGKRDYYANRSLGLQPFLRNLSFSLVDLRGMALNRPDLVRRLLNEVLHLIEERRLQPIPHRVFPIAQAEEAFRVMAQARHTGKIVLSLRDAERVPIAGSDAGLRCRADRTYLITGGLGGLGLTTAQWLVQQGARHLVLVGRSDPSPAAHEELARLREAGAAVLALKADISNHEDVARVFADMAETMPAPAGVVHAAGVLEDGILTQLDQTRFRKATAPKIAGAWNLHLLTRQQPLDFFVMYSSAASVLGAPGQGNYAAANSFLDALAHYRRAQGLPALSINWGPWAEVGLAAAQANRGERLSFAGVGSIAPQRGMEIFGELLAGTRAQISVLPLNLRQWRQSYPQLAETPLLVDLFSQESQAEPARSQSNDMRAALNAAAPSERLALLEGHLQQQIARVVRLQPAQIEPHTSFKNLGLDSLMALEARNRLESSLGLTLPVTMIFGYPTVTALAAHLMSRLQMSVTAPEPPAPSQPPMPRTAAPELNRINELTDEEVDRLFALRVARKGDA
jgi:acyl transferase domain-containing protein/acyl carrier protein/SAM-dependent methyltransferase